MFWQVAGAVTIGTTAHFEGIVLAKTMIAVNTGASANGRLLAQTAVTLQQNAVTQPDAVAVLPTSTNNAFNVVTGTQVAVTFGQSMDPATESFRRRPECC